VKAGVRAGAVPHIGQLDPRRPDARQHLPARQIAVAHHSAPPGVAIEKATLRPGLNISSIIAPYDKTKNKLGWEPKVRFKESVRVMLEYSLGNYNVSSY